MTLDTPTFEKHVQSLGVSQQYYYQQLNKQEQQAYVALYEQTKKYANSVLLLDTLTKEQHLKVREAFFLDNLEVSWATNHLVSMHSKGENWQEVIAVPDVENQRAHDTVRHFIEGVVRQVPDGTTYDKVKFVYEYVANYLTYDYDQTNHLDNQNLRNAVLYRKTVCTGYAKLFATILNQLNIENVLVPGVVQPSFDKPGGLHLWVMVNIDGKYYDIDPTWADTPTHIDYSYFGMSSKQLGQTHAIGYTLKQRYVLDEDSVNNTILWQHPQSAEHSIYAQVFRETIMDTYSRDELLQWLLQNIQKKQTPMVLRWLSADKLQQVMASFSELVDELAQKYSIQQGWQITHISDDNVLVVQLLP